MNRIYKYELRTLTATQDIDMPSGARVLSVGHDPRGVLCVWAEVDPNASTKAKRFHVVGTGNPLPSVLAFVGTVIECPYAWHVFYEDVE